MSAPLVLTAVAGKGGAGPFRELPRHIGDSLAGLGAEPGDLDWLEEDRAFDLTFEGLDLEAARRSLGNLGRMQTVDFAIQALNGRHKRVFIADLESTIIENELLDDLAGSVGLREEVSEITARAMRGDVDFAAALRERVGLLRGLPANVLEEAARGIRYTPGAETLLRTLRARGVRTALVSGGFSVFTSRVRDALGFDTDHANTIEVQDGCLTGRVREPVLDAAGKARVLESLAAEVGGPENVLAVGDGANDLRMIAAAGLGVAYRGKPALRAAAAAAIDHGDLTTLLFFQGYRREEFRPGDL